MFRPQDFKSELRKAGLMLLPSGKIVPRPGAKKARTVENVR